MKIFKLILLSFMFTLIIIYTIFSNTVSEQVRTGIMICTNSIIPSLFPITFLCVLLINCNLLNELPKRLRLYFILVISVLSGYPVGTKLLKEAVNNGNIKSNQAAKIFPAFVSAGPGFTIGIAGLNVFSSKKAGMLLFCSQIFATLLLFILLKGHKVDINACETTNKKNKLIADSLKDSIISISNICGYVIIFCTFNGIINSIASDKISAIITYISEVTTGVLRSDNLYLTSALISWGGLCVHAQIISLAQGFNGKYIHFIKFRLIHVLTALITTKVLTKISYFSLPTFTNVKNTVLIATNNEIYIIFLMIFVIISLILSINRKSTGFISKDLL